MSELLAKLKKLQYQRSDSSPFSSHVEFDVWADNALPLLSFNTPLYNNFRSMVYATRSARSIEHKTQEIQNINSAIGILNQAIISLEVPEESKPRSEIALPEKLTLQWLYRHAPWQFYAWLLGALAFAFTLGLNFSTMLSAAKNIDPANAVSNANIPADKIQLEKSVATPSTIKPSTKIK